MSFFLFPLLVVDCLGVSAVLAVHFGSNHLEHGPTFWILLVDRHRDSEIHVVNSMPYTAIREGLQNPFLV